PVAQNDMRRIGDLISIDADRARLNTNLSPVDGVGVPGLAGAAEDLAQQRRGEAGEGTAAADLHFEEQRLALMHGHAARRADRLEPPFGRQTALVEGVAS